MRCDATVGGGVGSRTHLRLLEDCAVAIEELKWGDQLALHQAAGQDRRGCPPSRADGHLPEPCFEWEAPLAAHYLIHLFLCEIASAIVDVVVAVENVG